MHGLERALSGRLRVIYLNVDEEVGRRARTVYQVDKVPTIIMFNDAGSETYRTEGKLPRTGQIRDRLETAERPA